MYYKRGIPSGFVCFTAFDNKVSIFLPVFLPHPSRCRFCSRMGHSGIPTAWLSSNLANSLVLFFLSVLTCQFVLIVWACSVGMPFLCRYPRSLPHGAEVCKSLSPITENSGEFIFIAAQVHWLRQSIGEKVREKNTVANQKLNVLNRWLTCVYFLRFRIYILTIVSNTWFSKQKLLPPFGLHIQ